MHTKTGLNPNLYPNVTVTRSRDGTSKPRVRNMCPVGAQIFFIFFTMVVSRQSWTVFPPFWVTRPGDVPTMNWCRWSGNRTRGSSHGDNPSTQWISSAGGVVSIQLCDLSWTGRRRHQPLWSVCSSAQGGLGTWCCKPCVLYAAKWFVRENWWWSNITWNPSCKR